MSDLAGLKVGDELFISEGYGPGRIVKIEKVSPTGRVEAGSYIFNPDGRRRGGGSWSSIYAHLPTQEHRDEIERFAMQRHAQNLHAEVLIRGGSADWLRRYIAAIEPLVAERKR